MKYEKLVNLDLSKCKITSTGAAQIAKCLKNKQKKLQVVLLSQNVLELKGAQAFADYFRTYDTLRSLTVSTAALDSEAMKILLDLSPAYSLPGLANLWNRA